MSRVSLGLQDAPRFNVEDYGAIPDGATDSTTAINSAIADFNTAGSGTLYFPAGAYLASSALTTITASGLVLGDGMGAYDGSAYGSAVLQSSQTATLFTITAKTVEFRDIGLFNTYSGTPSAGAGIQVSGSFIGQKVDLTSAVVSGFYVNVDRQVGSQWVNTNVWNYKAVLYGEKIQNTVNQDAGDWVIQGCNYYAATNNATAGIRMVGAGGGKITGTKINGTVGAGQYVTGISVAMPTGVSTSILLIGATSVENVSGDGILVTTTGTATFTMLTVSGCQVGLYSNNSGRAVKISAAAAGGTSVPGGFTGAVIDGLEVVTDGTARAAVELINTDRVTLGEIQLIENFTSRYTSSGDTNTTDGAAVTLAGDVSGVSGSTSVDKVKGVAVTDAGTTDAVLTKTGSTTATWITPATNQLLIADTHSTPLIFGDLLQTEAQDELLYSD